MKKASDLIVRLGEYDFSKVNETQYIDMAVTQIKVYPRFSEQNYENDLSLVQLKDKVTYNSFVRPVCLPQPGEFYEGETAIVTGGFGFFSLTLTWTNIQVNLMCDGKFVG